MTLLLGCKNYSKLLDLKDIIAILGMDELSEEQKLTVSRARKIERFFSAFFVAEQFTGNSGVFCDLSGTIRGFKEIMEGKHDALPEQAFLYCGSIDDVVKKAKTMN